MTKRTRRFAAAGTVALVVLSGALLSAQTRQERASGGRARGARRDVPREVDERMRAMGDYLAGLQAFRVDAESVTEVVLEDGQRLQFPASSQVLMRRPDRLRSERRGAMANLVLYYDGSSMTVVSPHRNVYATIAAPHTLDEAVEFSRNELGIEAPAADLLASAPYDVLMSDVRSATDVGQEEIDGMEAHHLAFRNRGGTDWQIWVRDGDQPVPLRYVIVSTDVRSQPEFEVALRNWDVAPSVSDNDFRFEAGADMRQIEFRQAVEARNAARREPSRARRERREH
jgi:hypothetical protein